MVELSRKELGCRERLGKALNDVDVRNGAGAKLPLALDEKLRASASAEGSEKSGLGRPMPFMLLYIEWLVLFCDPVLKMSVL